MEGDRTSMDLLELKARVESLPVESQANIFSSIIVPSTTDFMHNANGVFFDLYQVSTEVLQQIATYVDIYFSRQRLSELGDPSKDSNQEEEIVCIQPSKEKVILPRTKILKFGKTKSQEIHTFLNSIQETSQKQQKRGSRMRFLMAIKKLSKRTWDHTTHIQDMQLLSREPFPIST